VSQLTRQAQHDEELIQCFAVTAARLQLRSPDMEQTAEPMS
jgi:hypothetical protein